MNKNQQYPEKLEDYQTEFMSNSALIEENSKEFEMELLKMEDSLESIEVTNNTSKKANNNHKQTRAIFIFKSQLRGLDEASGLA